MLADLCGQPAEPLPSLRDRQFVQVGREGFEQVLARFAPRLVFGVPDKLRRGGGSRRVDLRFQRLADFEPDGIARQAPGLRGRYAAGDPAASEQLDGILHAPEFQRLEATWRGLRYLLRGTGTPASLRIRVLHATRDELPADFWPAPVRG